MPMLVSVPMPVPLANIQIKLLFTFEKITLRLAKNLVSVMENWGQKLK